MNEIVSISHFINSLLCREIQKDSSDTNILLLVRLIKNVEETFESIKHLNCIVLKDIENNDPETLTF